MLSLTALRALAAAAKHRSLTQAAQDLGVTPGAVGHQIRQLEARIGRPLLWRDGGELKLGETARRALPLLLQGFDTLERACDLLAPPPEAAALTIAADPSFAALWLAPRLKAARDSIAPLEVRLVAPVETADLARQGVDLAITYRQPGGARVASRTLLHERVLPAASPSLLERAGGAAGAGQAGGPELDSLPLLHIDRMLGDDVYPTWADWFRHRGVARPDVAEGARFSLSIMAVQAAIAGQGAVLTSHLLLDSALAAGTLRALAPPRLGLPLVRSLVWPIGGPKRRSAERFAARLVELV